MTKKKPLPKKELERYKTLLLNMREKIFSDVSHLRDDSVSSKRDQNPGEYSDVADIAAESYDAELNFGLASTEEQLLRDIDHALKKIEDGSYGFCEKYEEPIPKPRLDVMPYARYSVKAQEEEEESKRNQ